jgi:hypothetical protein
MSCNKGRHVIAIDDKERSLKGDVIKCDAKGCDTYFRLVKEFDDNYFVQDLGKRV